MVAEFSLLMSEEIVNQRLDIIDSRQGRVKANSDIHRVPPSRHNASGNGHVDTMRGKGI
jgi:hypothetical protein